MGYHGGKMKRGNRPITYIVTDYETGDQFVCIGLAELKAKIGLSSTNDALQLSKTDNLYQLRYDIDRLID